MRLSCSFGSECPELANCPECDGCEDHCSCTDERDDAADVCRHGVAFDVDCLLCELDGRPDDDR